jgi:beta-hydroxylase
MSLSGQEASPGFLQRIRQERRRRVRDAGKVFRRWLRNYLGRQSLVGDAPVLDSGHFPFIDQFAENAPAIKAEVNEILKHREEIPLFQEVSSDQMRIAKGNNWRTFILFGFGSKLEKNCRQAPVTASLLETVPNLQTAWFSILSPGYHIPRHKGVTKGILRAHLGLNIPADAEKCRMRVGKETCVWREGEIFVFDDTYRHEVWNETDEERVILIFDFDRPMRFWGRQFHHLFVWLLKFTAYYQEPKSKMRNIEDRFEAATKRANENLEKMADPDD